MLGFRTPSRKDRDSIVLDVLYAHLGRGASGKLFDELRNKRGVGYAVHAIHEPGKYAGMFTVAVSTKKKHLSMVKTIITEQLNKAKSLSSKELLEAKQYVLGSLTMQKEDSKNVAERVSFWLFAASSASYNRYVVDLRQITSEDIARVIEKYCVKPVHIVLQESS
jgi:predicted Zn-dependent peptidase